MKELVNKISKYNSDKGFINNNVSIGNSGIYSLIKGENNISFSVILKSKDIEILKNSNQIDFDKYLTEKYQDELQYFSVIEYFNESWYTNSTDTGLKLAQFLNMIENDFNSFKKAFMNNEVKYSLEDLECITAISVIYKDEIEGYLKALNDEVSQSEFTKCAIDIYNFYTENFVNQSLLELINKKHISLYDVYNENITLYNLLNNQSTLGFSFEKDNTTKLLELVIEDFKNASHHEDKYIIQSVSSCLYLQDIDSILNTNADEIIIISSSKENETFEFWTIQNQEMFDEFLEYAYYKGE